MERRLNSEYKNRVHQNVCAGCCISEPNATIMNCAECQDDLVAYIEGLLDREASLECRAHLEACAGCRAEYKAITSLQQRLTCGLGAAKLSSIGPIALAKDEPVNGLILTLIKGALKSMWTKASLR